MMKVMVMMLLPMIFIIMIGLKTTMKLLNVGDDPPQYPNAAVIFVGDEDCESVHRKLCP